MRPTNGLLRAETVMHVVVPKLPSHVYLGDIGAIVPSEWLCMIKYFAAQRSNTAYRNYQPNRTQHIIYISIMNRYRWQTLSSQQLPFPFLFAQLQLKYYPLGPVLLQYLPSTTLQSAPLSRSITYTALHICSLKRVCFQFFIYFLFSFLETIGSFAFGFRLGLNFG